jgi:hypothetical protein
VLVGLLVLAISIGGSLAGSTAAGKSVVTVAPVVLAAAICAGWWRLVTQVRAIAPHGFQLGAYREEPAFSTVPPGDAPLRIPR